MISLKFISEELNQTSLFHSFFIYIWLYKAFNSRFSASRYCYFIEAKITGCLCYFLSSPDRFSMDLYFSAAKTDHRNHSSFFLFPIISIMVTATAFSSYSLGQVLWGVRVCLHKDIGQMVVFAINMLHFFIHPFIWQIFNWGQLCVRYCFRLWDTVVTKTNSLLSQTDKSMGIIYQEVLQ